MPFALTRGGLPKGQRPADANCIMVRVESEEIKPMARWYRQGFPSLGG